MTKSNFLIATAAFFGLFSIVFDQAAYQTEKQVSLTEISIENLADEELKFSSFNQFNARFTAETNIFYNYGSALWDFYYVAAVAKNKRDSFNESALPCSAELFLKAQIIELRPLISQMLAHPLIGNFLDANDLSYANETRILKNDVKSGVCEGMTAKDFSLFLLDVKILTILLDEAFAAGQKSFEAAEEKNKLETKKIDQEGWMRFSSYAPAAYYL